MGLQATSASSTLLNGLADPEEDPRRRAAEALGTVAQNDPSVAVSLTQLVESDPSGMMRRNAALSLARLGPNAKEAVPALAKGMTDPTTTCEDIWSMRWRVSAHQSPHGRHCASWKYCGTIGNNTNCGCGGHECVPICQTKNDVHS